MAKMYWKLQTLGQFLDVLQAIWVQILVEMVLSFEMSSLDIKIG